MNRYHRCCLGVPPEFERLGISSFDAAVEWDQPTHAWILNYVNFSGSFFLNQTLLPFPAYSLIIIPPSRRCRIEAEAPAKGKQEMDRAWIGFIPDQKSRDEMAIPVIAHLGELGPHFERELRLGLDYLQQTRTFTKSLLWRLLWKTAQPTHLVRKSIYVEKAEQIMMARLDQRLEIGEIAHELEVSHNHLIQLFKQEFGVTPAEFLRSRRVQLAYKLLTTTTMPIKAIAANVGIPDIQQFNKLIRNALGSSPRDVRQNRMLPQEFTRTIQIPND